MSKYKFIASKGFGQNFITDSKVCPDMADVCLEEGAYGVFEIGPGIGTLTVELAKRFEKVVSVEIDKKLIPVLNETLSKFKNIKIISADIMRINISEIIYNEFVGNNICVCANLPYYITSAVIMRFLEEEINVKSLVFMVQKEAALRLCAKPGSNECGAVSASIRYYADPEILFDVPGSGFFPVPKVDSCVIRLRPNKNNRKGIKSKEIFFKILKASFAKRRKTLANALNGCFDINKSDIENIILRNKISPSSRAERLSFEDFVNLSNDVDFTK